jgi:hypothetical protein
MPQAEGAVAPPRTLAPRSGRRGRRTKPRPHKRKPMRGGISRNLPGDAERLFTSRKARRTGEGRGNRPAAGAGGKRGRAQAQAATRTEFLEEASAFERRSGRAARPSGGAAIRKGFPGAYASGGSSKNGKASAQGFSKRATGEASASMRARGDGAASAGPDPEGKRRRDASSARATRRGSAGGLTASPETHRMPNEALRPRSGIRGRAARAYVYATRSKAAQRETASPPSDGSQSWDKWGPVATPAPIMIPGG